MVCVSSLLVSAVCETLCFTCIKFEAVGGSFGQGELWNERLIVVGIVETDYLNKVLL